jgi:uncharacterized protein (TIGR00661 family)
MSKILYGVAGEGFGHSTRSQIIGKYLLDRGHDVLFVGSMKSLHYLNDYFPERVREIFGLTLVYKKTKLKMIDTVITNIQRAPEGFNKNKILFDKEIKRFNPDLVISDFEPFTIHWSEKKKKPCLSIDHQGALTYLKLDPVKGSLFSKIAAKILTKTYYRGIVHHIIVNFFRAEVTSQNCQLAPPVIRPQAKQFQTTTGKHLVCYISDRCLKDKMIRFFNQIKDLDFYIYGLNEESQKGNCFFKKTATKEFLQDLSGSIGVISMGGFSLISECLYFNKKILLMPPQGHYEQIINTYYVEKLGLGMFWKDFDLQTFTRFLESIDIMPVHEDLVLRPNNQQLFSILDRKIEELVG